MLASFFVSGNDQITLLLLPVVILYFLASYVCWFISHVAALQIKTVARLFKARLSCSSILSYFLFQHSLEYERMTSTSLSEIFFVLLLVSVGNVFISRAVFSSHSQGLRD